MACTSTFLEVVEIACAQAGLGSESYAHAKKLLNLKLKSWALKKKWPELRKVGSTIALAASGTTATLPTDFGAGMDSLLITTGTNKPTPLIEVEWDEYVKMGGIFGTSTGTGRPTRYVIDRQAGVIRFNYPADQAYTLYPIYYRLPPIHPYNSTGDAEYPWYTDDQGLIQGLIEDLYQYSNDDREVSQRQEVVAEVGEYRRGSSGMDGGTGSVRLSGQWFKNRGK